jgi:hypothetical protein
LRLPITRPVHLLPHRLLVLLVLLLLLVPLVTMPAILVVIAAAHRVGRHKSSRNVLKSGSKWSSGLEHAALRDHK